LEFSTESCCDALILVEGIRSLEEVYPSQFRQIDGNKTRKDKRRNKRNKNERKKKRKFRGTGALAIWDKVVERSGKNNTEIDKKDTRLHRLDHPSILKVLSGDGNILNEPVFSYNNASTISVLFYSDYSVSRTGFNIRWSVTL